MKSVKVKNSTLLKGCSVYKTSHLRRSWSFITGVNSNTTAENLLIYAPRFINFDHKIYTCIQLKYMHIYLLL